MPITRNSAGLFTLGGEGEVVEWALRMHRFDQARLYEGMAEEGRLGILAMRPLAKVVAAFHTSADRWLTPKQSVLQLEGATLRQ